MKPKPTPARQLTLEQRQELSRLLDNVPASADDAREFIAPVDAPEFIRLCEAWQAIERAREAARPIGTPWQYSGVPAYRCAGGSWYVQSVARVLAAIRTHVEEVR